jgi:hypothetical protein
MYKVKEHYIILAEGHNTKVCQRIAKVKAMSILMTSTEVYEKYHSLTK